jgi:hypothetical protein
MKFNDWNWKHIEDRILEAAETLRALPADRGPKGFGSAMPECVKTFDEKEEGAIFRPKKAIDGGALSRMDETWTWINNHLDEPQRRFIYGWAWVKVRKGMKISAFAKENGTYERKIRREIQIYCQWIANNLNRNVKKRLTIGNLQLSENTIKGTQSIVDVENCNRDLVRRGGLRVFRPEDAKPIL